MKHFITHLDNIYIFIVININIRSAMSQWRYIIQRDNLHIPSCYPDAERLARNIVPFLTALESNIYLIESFATAVIKYVPSDIRHFQRVGGPLMCVGRWIILQCNSFNTGAYNNSPLFSAEYDTLLLLSIMWYIFLTACFVISDSSMFDDSGSGWLNSYIIN